LRGGDDPVTLTHTQRYHARTRTAGYGHLYQGRYKSLPVETDQHFLTLVRYVERNAKRAALVTRGKRCQVPFLRRDEVVGFGHG
jgi:putative transposase